MRHLNSNVLWLELEEGAGSRVGSGSLNAKYCGHLLLAHVLQKNAANSLNALHCQLCCNSSCIRKLE